MVELPAQQAPTPELLTELRRTWDNNDFSGKVDYLLEVARWAMITPGPVLECGSGLSTILLALLAGRRGVEVWSLEHLPEWHARVASVLESLRVPTVHLDLMPLRSYGDFDWYDPPLARVPPEFRLVICDGPPGTTRGGRYGLLPIMGARLPKGSLVFFDDATRPEEQAAIERWAGEAGWSATLRAGLACPFAVIDV